MTIPAPLKTRIDALNDAITQRILILDGGMGTMIQSYKLQEADYRGARFADYHMDIAGNNDLLSITKPEVIREIQRAYLEAGADILETNTFNSTRISMADYDMEELSFELNCASAKLARELCDEFTTRNPAKPRFVAGVLGPTSRTCSISPDVNDPGARNVTFDQLVENYLESMDGLVKGGADIILIETIFDTLNAKCAAMAAQEAAAACGRDVPLMISMTITDMAGRNLSGHTVEAFWAAIRHAKPLTIGLNCSFGADLLRQHLAALSKQADVLVMAYPNAGLPNDLAEYDELPETTAQLIGQWLDDGLVNIVGGCCGTTPAHIAAIAKAVAKRAPRTIPKADVVTRLAGLEPFVMAS